MSRISTWKTKQKEELRQALIQTTHKLLEENGFDFISIDEIVNRVGIAKGTFYLYFKSKSELIEAVLDDGLTELEAVVSDIMTNQTQDATEELRNIIKIQLSFFEEHHPIIAALMTGEGSAKAGLAEDIWNALRMRYRAATISIYEKIICYGIESGIYRDVDPYIASIGVYGIIVAFMYESIETGRSLAGISNTVVDLAERCINHD